MIKVAKLQAKTENFWKNYFTDFSMVASKIHGFESFERMFLVTLLLSNSSCPVHPCITILKIDPTTNVSCEFYDSF